MGLRERLFQKSDRLNLIKRDKAPSYMGPFRDTCVLMPINSLEIEAGTGTNFVGKFSYFKCRFCGKDHYQRAEEPDVPEIICGLRREHMDQTGSTYGR